MTLAREQRKTALKSHRFSSTFSSVDSGEKQRFWAHSENEPVWYDEAQLRDQLDKFSKQTYIACNTLHYCASSWTPHWKTNAQFIFFYANISTFLKSHTLNVRLIFLSPEPPFSSFPSLSCWEQLNAATTNCRTLWNSELLTSWPQRLFLNKSVLWWIRVCFHFHPSSLLCGSGAWSQVSCIVRTK